MARTSPVFFIAPQAIIVIPNANGSSSDLAVTIDRGAKIKVYAPKAGIDMVDSSWQEWTLRGRNRRLSDAGVGYTVYARLNKADRTDGYLVFAPKQPDGKGKWLDKYPYVTLQGLADGTAGHETGNYWYVKMGDVSAPVDARRTLDLDTGILGTDQYNSEWQENPDGLPLRLEIGCTIDDEDAGPTPYVAWGRQAVLTASLTEGWTTDAASRVRYWTIQRNSGNADADEAWNRAAEGEASEPAYRIMADGRVVLQHVRGDADDFAGAMSAIFTVTAWGEDNQAETEDAETTDEPESSEGQDSSDGEEGDGSEEPAIVAIATGTITILAETAERYELVLSDNLVYYNPQTGEYRPKGSIAVSIRATDQRGTVYKLSKAQFDAARLTVAYSHEGSDTWMPPLVFSGDGNSVAVATIPVAVFQLHQGISVRLTDAAGKELDTKPVSFLCGGEDTKEREWIFVRSQSPVVFGDAVSAYPLPSLIGGGEVEPAGDAGGSDTDKNQDGWVPRGWWDDMQGTDAEWRYEYASYRDFVRAEEPGETDHWGEFTAPTLWDRYTEDASSYRCRWMLGGVEVWQLSATYSGALTSKLPLTATLMLRRGSGAEEEVAAGPAMIVVGFEGPAYTKTVNAARPQLVVSESENADLIGYLNDTRLTAITITFSIDGESFPYSIPVVREGDENNVQEAIEAYGADLFISKKNNDVARGLISFLRGLQIGEDFVSGLLGEGGIFRRDADGTTYLEADKMYIRMKAYFDTVGIRKYLHSAGNRVASVAGAKCIRVEYIDADGNVTSDAANAAVFRCYFRGSDGDDEITNDFLVGDQVYCHITNGSTKSLQMHHYWRLIVGRNAEGELTEDGEHWIDLSNRPTETVTIDGSTYTHAGYQTGSDIPVAQDDMVQLGNISDKTRQGAIIEYVSGADSPSYQIYQGINDFSLDGKNQLALGYNTQTGRAYMNVYGDAYIGDKAQDGGYMEYDSNTHTLNIMGHLRVGSTLEDGRDINTLGTKRGNLLRNTGFTGDYKSEPITAHTHVNPNTVIFSDPLAHWVADKVTVISSEESVSGMAAQIGSLQQEIDGGLTIGEWYILSFRARGSVVNYSIGGVSGSISLTPVVTRYDIPLLCGQDTPLRLEGKATVMELQLMAGSLPTEWQKSYRDNDRAMAEYHALKYLRDAITGANTDIIGGLILSQILKVGNYRNGVMMEETGGISGARNDDNSPFLWGGGSMEQAIYTIMKYASDPSQAVTDTDLSNMAKFVVTHGGRAILNDIILRGWIYAQGGEINGNLNVVGGSINAKAVSSTDNGQGNILKCTKTNYQADAVWGNRYKTESGIVSGIWWKCRKYNNLGVNVYKVNLTTKVKIGIKSFPYRSTWTEGELVRLAFDSIVNLEKDEYIGIDAPIYFTDTLTDSTGKSFSLVGTTVGGIDNTAIGFYSYYDTSSRPMVQVNGMGDSVSESEDVTIIDSRGFYIKRGNNGFRLTTNGLERWNPKAVVKTIGAHFTTEGAWQPFYSTRFVRNVEINNGGWYELNEYDDFVIVKVVNSGSEIPWIKLPSSNISSGKVITIKATGTTINVTTRQSKSESDSEANKLILYGNGNTKVSYKDLNDSHRAELVYDGQYWWWNYMDV